MRQFLNGEPDYLKEGKCDDWECCGCGLTHHIEVKKTKGGFRVRVWVDGYATNKARSRKKK